MQLKHLIYEYRLAREVYHVDYMETALSQIARKIENYPLLVQKIIWRRVYKPMKEFRRMGLLRRLVR